MNAVVLRWVGAIPHDVAIYSLNKSGVVEMKILDPEFEFVSKGVIADGVYCHDDGDKSKMVMPSEGQRFLDNLLADNRATYYELYDPDHTKT